MPYTEQRIGFRNTETSKAAALAVVGRAGTVRAKVLAAFRATSTAMTADEVAERLSLPFISVRPRVCELFHMGLLKDSGERRMGRFGKAQIAWRLA